mmetsp:Transcript_20883/g.51195  ORF Transcript_20883/g.51195 Transcript_20883/m.51195 type:complete len:128 (-) Transcript_20883:521-904(-)
MHSTTFQLKQTLNQKTQLRFIKIAIKDNIWYYKDRLNVSRGPCDLKILKSCWINGIIDQNTLVWGQGLDQWIPLKNVRGLLICIRSPEVQLATKISKEFKLKPRINKIRRIQNNRRKYWSDQLNNIY